MPGHAPRGASPLVLLLGLVATGCSASSHAPEAKAAAQDGGVTESSAAFAAEPAEAMSCNALRQQHERAFAEGDYTDCKPNERPSQTIIDSTFGCVETPRGVVAQYIGEVERRWTSNAGPCPLLELTVLTWIPGGAEPGDVSTVQLPGSAPREDILERLPRLVAALDFDGDRSPEWIFETFGLDEDLRGVPTLVLTTQHGPYERAPRYSAPSPNAYALPQVRIARVEDYDGDGRLNLVVRSPFHAEWGTAEGIAYLELLHLPLLAHSLPDGTFSESDGTAQAFARSSCPARPGELTLDPSSRERRVAAGRQIACLRLWGESAQAVTARLRTVCRRFPEFDTDDERVERKRAAYPPGECPGWWLRWANAAVPFAFDDSSPRE